jgi:hypothetical protein
MKPKGFVMFRRIVLTICLAGFSGLSGAETPESKSVTAKSAPVIGAIRWDGWFDGNTWQRNLDAAKWHDRLPFYADDSVAGAVRVVDDTQAIMDQEIAYAAAGGLDYWAFCYYHPTSWPEADKYNHSWKRYLASKDRGELDFCLLLQGGQHMGPAKEWSDTVAKFVGFFKEPGYQQVENGRPLLFIFYCENLVPHFGGMEAARQAMDLLRQESIKAGAGDPYIVAQIWLPMLEDPFIDGLGFDALSAYSAHGDAEPELPHARLAEINREYWDAFKASGRAVVPLANAGWDGSPRDYEGSWFVQGTPEEVASSVMNAVDWVAENPTVATANVVLVYAWNEFDEGGWLCPTLDEGSARLDALASARKTESMETNMKDSDSITVASYYFPNYHPGDPRNVQEKGAAWTEWELMKAAKPRFPGHQQPKVPLWGYEDESDPKVMAKKIAAAADHGVDAFIFDWYHYDDGPFLNRCLDEGYLKAPNRERVKFSLMWANHDWITIFPYHKGAEQKVLYPGIVSPEGFERIGRHVIQDYFLQPSYWRIDGKPYFSFYDLTKLMAGFGSLEATREALDKFRAQAREAGLPGIHLNAVVWGRAILPGEGQVADARQLVEDLGFDSVTSYVWVHHVPLNEQQTDYNLVRDQYLNYWDQAEAMFDVPYYPNVSMGWDPSPRCFQEDEFGNFGYPFTNTMGGNTPERFREALKITRDRLLTRDNPGTRIFNINCWNEWTEGSYLEPDTISGMAYLEAVAEVFGTDETVSTK